MDKSCLFNLKCITLYMFIETEIESEMVDLIVEYIRKYTGIPSRKLEISLIKDF